MATQRRPRLKRILCVGDLHAPFHDRRAFRLMVKAATEMGTDIIVTCGDTCDMYTVSSHSKDPSRERSLKKEIDSCKRALNTLNEIGASRKIFIAGNHDDRISRYIADNAPALYECFDIPTMYGLESGGWEYVPYKDHIQIGKVYFTHDAGSAGRDAHVKAGQAFEHSVVIGHVHRLAINYWGNAVGESHVSAAIGWLGDVSKIDYMHKIKAKRDWHLGFGWGHLEESTGHLHLNLIPIIDYRCVVDGKLFVG